MCAGLGQCPLVALQARPSTNGETPGSDFKYGPDAEDHAGDTRQYRRRMGEPLQYHCVDSMVAQVDDLWAYWKTERQNRSRTGRQKSSANLVNAQFDTASEAEHGSRRTVLHVNALELNYPLPHTDLSGPCAADT